MVIDNLNNCKLYFSMHKNFAKAFEFIKKAVDENLPKGKYEIDGKELYASVQEYNSKLRADAKSEGHKSYIDIQFIISGTEAVDVFDISKATPKTEYNPEKDAAFYEDLDSANHCVLSAGEYGIFFPHDIHKPGLSINETPAAVKKIVVKVRV